MDLGTKDWLGIPQSQAVEQIYLEGKSRCKQRKPRWWKQHGFNNGKLLNQPVCLSWHCEKAERTTAWPWEGFWYKIWIDKLVRYGPQKWLVKCVENFMDGKNNGSWSVVRYPTGGWLLVMFLRRWYWGLILLNIFINYSNDGMHSQQCF